MARPDISALSDADLTALIEQARGLLATRQEQRKKDAVEAARARLAEVGLTFRDVAAKSKSRTDREQSRERKGAVKPPTGGRYINPSDPSQVWVAGRGRRPDWVKVLEAKGQLPDPQ
jgi:DNA-binding protein H-NS